MSFFEETRGIQFELVRHFLAGMFDSEMFSSRGQWGTAAISAFALAAPAGLLLLDAPYLHNMAPVTSPPIADELAVLTLLFAITGVLALLAWQFLFPTRRDFLALAGFPAQPRQIFAARFAAVLVFAVTLVLTISFLPSVIPPHFFRAPSQAGMLARGMPAVLGCLFVFFAIVALQGLLLNVMPARFFMSASTLVQGALVATCFLGGLYSWFIVDWKAQMVARLPELGWWAPPVWFAGLFQVLAGDRDPFYQLMAERALGALAAALMLAGLMYLVSYRRYRKLLLESPDNARALWKGSILSLVARDPKQEAIIEFMSAVIARSRTHRLVLMAYAGAALGIMINSVLLAGFRHGSQGVVQFAALYWPLGTSFIMLAGIRHVFSLPAELPCNWLFQITESQGRREWMSAVERFVVVGVIAPIYLISTPVAATVLDWPVALRMAVLQLLVSLITFDLMFNEWQQLPFTCSYVPGKHPLMSLAGSWIAVLGVVTPILTIMIATVTRMPELFLLYGAVFAGDWIWARRRRREGWGEARLTYEDRFGRVTSLGIEEMSYRNDVVEAREIAEIHALEPPEIPDAAPGIWLRLKALVHRDQLDQDLDDELQFHLAMSGQRQFGNVATVKEECREQWTFVLMETLWQDIRYGARQLRRAPAFTVAATLTLALGIGAATAVYSMCQTVLWRPVALPRLDSLAMVLQEVPGNPHLWSPAAPADIAEIRDASTTTEGVASWSYGMANIAAEGREPARVEQVRVTANFFQIVGVQPAMGRALRANDDRQVILSDGCWRRRFGADPAIVGKSIWLDDRKFTVIGVMPPTFAFPRVSKELWTLLTLTPEQQRSRDALMVDSIARLKPGLSIRDFAAELNVLGTRLDREHPAADKNRRFMAWPVQRFWTGDYAAQISQMLLGAAIFVLLICCVNVGNLQFARVSRRGREIAIRAAIGAGRVRVIRQLLTEVLLLAGLGAVVGLQISGWVLHIIKAGVPAEMRQYMPGWAEIGLNERALVFALLATLLCGAVAGLAPALRSARRDLADSLKDGGFAASAGRGRQRLRSALVAGEIAMATVLLLGAGLMVRGFRGLIDSGAALEPDSLLTLRVSLTDGSYREVLDRIAMIPGVRSAAVVTALPHSRHASVRGFEIEGRPERLQAQVVAASPGYFDTLHIALRSGRLLSAGDGAEQPRVAAITQSLCDRWWPGEAAPIGRRVKIGAVWSTIVGVVSDVETPQPTIYLSYLQAGERDMDIAIRTSVAPMSLGPEVRAAVGLRRPITNLNTMRELIRQESFGLVYAAALMGVFGGLALALSFVGVYGLLSYLVTERTREVGVRIALGASPRAIVGMFCREGLHTAAMGLAIGFVLAGGLMRVMGATIVGVDSASLALWSMPLVLSGAVALAIYLPARRATRVDPLLALREE
jgi:putative ABC transport system permease protein